MAKNSFFGDLGSTHLRAAAEVGANGSSEMCGFRSLEAQTHFHQCGTD